MWNQPNGFPQKGELNPSQSFAKPALFTLSSGWGIGSDMIKNGVGFAVRQRVKKTLLNTAMGYMRQKNEWYIWQNRWNIFYIDATLQE